MSEEDSEKIENPGSMEKSGPGRPKRELPTTLWEREPIQGVFAAEVQLIGTSYYLRLNPRDVRFWDLDFNDVVECQLLMVRRCISEAEANRRMKRLGREE